MSTAPQSDPQAMPLADLKQAAGLSDPQPVAPAAPAVPVAAPVVPQPVVPDKFAMVQDDNGVTITLPPEYGGEVYKGKDAAEVLAKLAGSKADANAYIKQLKSQPAPAAQPQPVAQPEPVDPAVQATRDWVLDEVAKGLGLPGKDALLANFGLMSRTSGQMASNIAIAEFHQLCPGYVDTPENSAALMSYFPDDFQGFPSPQDFKTAYALAVIDGKITPQTAAAQPPARPPVMPTAGATAPGNSNQSAWTMPLDQLKKDAGLV